MQTGAQNHEERREGPWSAPVAAPPHPATPRRRMGMGEAVRTCFARYFTFSGRASRAEFWWFTLFTFLVGFGLGFIEAFVSRADVAETRGSLFPQAWQLATFMPSLTVGWRRMHDTGRSGLFLIYPLLVMLGIAMFTGLMVSTGAFDPAGAATGTFGAAGLLVLALAGFVFLISPLLVLWWLARPSQPGANKYGPNPHEVSP